MPYYKAANRRYNPYFGDKKRKFSLVAKRKSSNPTWSEVKPAVINLDQKQLVKLVADLYRFSKENQAFLHARFGLGDDPLDPYKKTIDACMYTDVYSNKPIQISKAKRAIKKVISLPEEQRSVFQDRLEEIMTSSSGIGWGYHDMLSDDYYSAFPKEEE